MSDVTPILGLAGLILVKEVGIPVPVPGDLVVIGAGVAASHGDLDPAVALFALIVASIAGGTVQFGLLRSVARPAMLRLLARLGAADRVDRQVGRLGRAGPGRIAAARMTPGVRIVTIAASAIAGAPPGAFIVGLSAGNAVFIGAHFGLGYAVGDPVLRLVGAALAPLALIGIGLAAVGLVGWLAIRSRRSTARGATVTREGRAVRADGPGALASWADACCPACLVLGGAAERSAG
jgi:membrane protein DedA with SNARE-associated domain